MKKTKENKGSSKKLCAIDIVAIVEIVIVIGLLIWDFFWVPIYDTVTIEAGEEIQVDIFFRKEVKSASFASDISLIDTSVPGTYSIWFNAKGDLYESQLVVVDTVAPTAEPTYVETIRNEIPAPQDCISNLVDESAVTIEYAETPDLANEGEVETVIVLTDAGNNVTQINATITVLGDHEAPVIEGVEDLEVMQGKSLSYKKNISVTDNEDPEPKLEIDNSEVDLDTPGEYTVTYIATDKDGNTATVDAKVTVIEKTTKYYEEEVVEMAKVILDEIVDPSMTDMEVAFEIYKWAVNNLVYTGYSDKSDWTVAAYNAFNYHSGDCFTFFAATKAMCMAAGFETCDVVKSVTTYSRHYWIMVNYGDGWYHLDACPRGVPGDDFFLVTDEELEAFSVTHWNSHIYDTSLVPKSSTVSLQHLVDYYKLELIDENQQGDSN